MSETTEAATLDPSEHCRLAPSSASRWIPCPGSARSDLPDRRSAAADQGTLAHAVANAELLERPMPPDVLKAFLGQPQEDIEEMTRGVALFVEFVRGIPGDHYYEQKILSKSIPEFGGTLDDIAVTELNLHVTDLKYGTMFVPAVNNYQLKSYLVLARELFPGRKRFFGTIVQPRVQDGRVETHEYTKKELDEFELQVIEAGFDDSIVAGAHCRWCPLLINCDKAAERAALMAQESFDEVDTETDTINRMKALIEFAPVVSKLSELAEAKLLYFIKQGVPVPGYKAGRSRKHRCWKDPDNIVALLDAKGISRAISIESDVRSPAKLEKMVPRELIEDLWHQPPGNISLVTSSSKLEEVTFDEFDVYEG